MKSLGIAAGVLILSLTTISLTTPLSASVVVGDNKPVFELGQYGLGTGESIAQSFSVSEDTMVNQVDLSLDLILLSHTSGVYPITIHIANGLAAGSHDLLTLNENLPIPADSSVSSYSFGFFPITLPAGTYYLIITSSYPAQTLEWEQDQVGSVTVGSIGAAYVDNGPEFGSGWQVLPAFCPPGSSVGVCYSNGIMAFDLDYVQQIPVPVGGAALGQVVRLTVVAGPAIVPPGAPVEANLGFVDVNNNPIGPTAQVALNPGETASLDFNASTLVNQLGERVEVRPTLTPIFTDLPTPSLQASVEVFDLLTGYGTVLAPAVNAVSPAPAFLPQGLADGQTMRLIVVAYPPDPCIGLLSFADKNGTPLGSSMPVNLTPGTATSLDLNANSLGLKLGQRIEVQPAVTAQPSITSGPPITSACQASVEVFDHLTGRTWTYQLGGLQLPAVQ
jgi:hypothetical protein